MKVDLNHLPYRMAFDIIKWCAEHDVDKEKCIELLEAMSIAPPPDVVWELDIPEKYITMFVLKWSGQEF